MVEQLAVNQWVVGSSPTRGAKLYVASLLPRRFAPRQADCIVFAKIFWVQSPPFAKAKRGSSQWLPFRSKSFDFSESSLFCATIIVMSFLRFGSYGATALSANEHISKRIFLLARLFRARVDYAKPVRNLGAILFPKKNRIQKYGSFWVSSIVLWCISYLQRCSSLFRSNITPTPYS